MKRTTITMYEYGRVAVPSDTANVWMSEMELMEPFDTIAPTLRAAIRAVYKSGALKPCEVERRIKLPNGYYSEAYSLPMVVALAFRVDTPSASNVRKALLAKRKANFVGFNGQQTLMQMLDCALCKLLQPVYKRFNLMWCCNDISKPINRHIPLPTNICGNPFARRSAVLLLRAFLFAI